MNYSDGTTNDLTSCGNVVTHVALNRASWAQLDLDCAKPVAIASLCCATVPGTAHAAWPVGGRALAGQMERGRVATRQIPVCHELPCVCGENGLLSVVVRLCWDL